MPSKPTPPPADDDIAPARELTNKQRRKMSKREQAAYSLEMVEVRRREARARTIRRRLTVGVAILAAVAVVGTGSGLLVWAQVRAGEAGPANMLSDGILLTGATDSSTQAVTITPVTTEALQPDAKPVATDLAPYSSTANIVIYVDYGAPKTAKFDAAQSVAIDNWLAAGYITLEVHPIDPSVSATNDYSRRAANAAACVAATSPNNFLAVHAALLKAASTTKETSKSNAALVALVKKAGVTDATAISCIDSGTYNSWVTAATQRAEQGKILNANVKSLTSTPMLIVNKKHYTGSMTDNTALTTFISNTFADAAAGDSSTASPTPTPTPTPSAG